MPQATDPHAISYVSLGNKVQLKVISPNQGMMTHEASLTIETRLIPRPKQQKWLSRLWNGPHDSRAILQYFFWLYRNLGIIDKYLVIMDRNEAYLATDKIEMFVTDDKIMPGSPLANYRDHFEKPLFDYWSELGSDGGHVNSVLF